MCNNLPNEIISNVFSYLDGSDLVRASLTCSDWNLLAEDLDQWKRICGMKRFEFLENNQETQKNRLSQLKSLYKERLPLTKRNCMETSQIAHLSSPVSCLGSNEEQLIVGTFKEGISIFRRKTGEEIKTLEKPRSVEKGLENDISCLQFTDNFLAYGMSNGSVVSRFKIDDKIKRICDHHFSSPVHSLQFDREKMIVGIGHLSPQTLNAAVWIDLESGAIDREFKDQQHLAITATKFNGSQLVTGSADKSIKVWDLINAQCNATLSFHQEGITSINFIGSDYFVSTSLDKTVKVWDCRNLDQAYANYILPSSILSASTINSTIVAGGIDGNVYLMDLEGKVCSLKNEKLKESVMSVHVEDRNSILIGTDSGKIYNVNF